MTTQEILQGVRDWTNGKIVYDISVAHPDGQGKPTPYANLAAALGTGGANVPEGLRKGGMSVKFIKGSVQSSDNKYVQYRLVSDTFSTNENDWINIEYKFGVELEFEKNARIEDNGMICKNTPTNISNNKENYFDISDEQGNVIVEYKNGDIKTLNFDSKNTPKIITNPSSSNLSLSDNFGNIIVLFDNGNIKTKNFDSTKLTKDGSYLLYNAFDTSYDGFTGSDWTLNNNQYYNNTYGINNQLLLNKEYAITGRTFICDFEISQDGIAYFGAKAMIRNAGNPRGLVSVNSRNNTINIHKGGNTDTITEIIKSNNFTDNIESTKLRIIITYSYWHLAVELRNLKDYHIISTVASDMTQNTSNSCYFADRPFIFSEYSSIRIYNFMVSVPSTNDKCWLWICGDSITQGVGTPDENDSYAGRIKNRLQNDGRFCLISGRSSCDIDNVIQRIDSELSIIKSKYALVLIGSNGGNTVQKVKDMIESIISIGSIPIICHIPSPSSTRNSVNSIIDDAISQVNGKVITCYMDIATSLNYDLSSGLDQTLFTDGTHPNAKGAEHMYIQTLVDCYELYKS